MAPFSSNTAAATTTTATTSLNRYDNLFREAFAQRTILTLIHFSILYFISSIFIEIFIPTTSRSTPLTPKWLLEHCPTIITFIPMLLITLKPLASSNTENNLFHSFILHLIPFLILNSSSLLQTPFIEGGMPSPHLSFTTPKPYLLLVKPFYILINAILISFISNVIMVFRYRSIVIPLHREKVHFPSLLRNRMRGFLKRSLLALTITFGIILFDVIFLGGGRPTAYHFVHLILSKILPLTTYRMDRGSLFSYFGSFSTIILLIKLAITGFYTLFLHHLMDLLIEVNFGSPFNLVINQFTSTRPNGLERYELSRTLLMGLGSSSLESMQAFMELEYLLSSEDDNLIIEWRREMWRGLDDDYYDGNINGEEVVMSSLLDLLLDKLSLISKKLSDDRMDLSFIKNILDSKKDSSTTTTTTTMEDGGKDKVESEEIGVDGETTITYPIPNMFKNMDDEKKRLSLPRNTTVTTEDSYRIRDSYLRLIWLSINQLDTRNSLLKDLALSAIEIRKSYMLIGDSMLTFTNTKEANLSLLLSSLTLLIKDSLLVEGNDVHSIIQLRIGDIYSSLIKLHDSYTAFENDDGLCGGALGRRCKRLKNEVIRTMDEISYPSSLLPRDVKEGLERILL